MGKQVLFKAYFTDQSTSPFKERIAYIFTNVCPILKKPIKSLFEAWQLVYHFLFQHKHGKQWYKSDHGADSTRHILFIFESNFVVVKSIFFVP